MEMNSDNAKKKHTANNPAKLAIAAGLTACLVCLTACGSQGSSGTSALSGSSGSANHTKVNFEYVSPSELSSESTSKSSKSKQSSSAHGGQKGTGQNGNNSTPPSKPPGEQGGSGGPVSGGADTASYDYTGANSATLSATSESKNAKGKTIKSSISDKNAALVKNGNTLELVNAELIKSGSDSNGDNCNFYGLNSSLLAIGKKSKAYLSKSSISSTSTGSNGLFATDNARIYAANTKITTKKEDNARGLDATYGGVIYANKLTVSTEGEHCAAAATDRGGGFISLTNSSLHTKGSGSPLLYSTGDIEADNVKGTASGSQIAGMEGLNRILIYHSDLKSTNDAKTGSDPIKNGVILYQSTSGDAEAATSKKADFEAIDSKLTTSITNGAMFYVTNTNAKVVLENTKIKTGSKHVDLINAAGNSNNWGNPGSNGANLTFTARNQKLNGNVKVDTISSLKMYLLEDSTYTGKTSVSTNSSGNTSKSPITMNIGKNSKWTVTGNSTVTNLNAAEGSKIVDKDGNKVTIKAGRKTQVKGNSKYTITVTGTYSAKVKETSDTKLQTKVLSRSAFDKHFDVSTKFGSNAEKNI